MKFQSSTVVLLLGALSSLVSVAVANNSTHNATCSADVVRRLVFHASLQTFLIKRRAEDPYDCDWYEDGCSQAPNNPDGYHFIDACRRHDFAYRNYKRFDKLSEDVRHQIDDNFLQDLMDECDTHSGVTKAICEGYAGVYYGIVRDCGDGDCLARDIMGALSSAWNALKEAGGKVEDVWDATTGKVEDAWDATTGAIKDGWNSIF